MNNTKRTAAGANYWTYNPKGKKTIIAIHGLRGTHHGLEFIAKTLPSYKLIVPDLPGFGKSKPFRGRHDAENYAKWLDKFIGELKLKDTILLGHSFGSIIASQYVADQQNRISKLILINPISEQNKAIGSLLAKGYYKIGNLLPDPLGDRVLRSRLVTRAMSHTMMTTSEKQLKNRIHEQHFAYFATFSNKKTVNESFRSAVSSTVLENAENLDVPVLLIVGEKDIYAPLKSQRKLHSKIQNSKLHIIPRVGHLVHYETPENAAQAIDEFLS